MSLGFWGSHSSLGGPNMYKSELSCWTLDPGFLTVSSQGRRGNVERHMLYDRPVRGNTAKSRALLSVPPFWALSCGL